MRHSFSGPDNSGLSGTVVRVRHATGDRLPPSTDLAENSPHVTAGFIPAIHVFAGLIEKEAVDAGGMGVL
jgi:hypothetical protein